MKLPSDSIRDNVNLWIFFEENKSTLTNIWKGLSFVGINDCPSFRKLCDNLWKDKDRSYLTINIEEPTTNLKYTKNFESSFINNEKEGLGYSSVDKINNSKSLKAQASKDLRNYIANRSNQATESNIKHSIEQKPIIDALVGNPQNPEQPSLANVLSKPKSSDPKLAIENRPAVIINEEIDLHITTNEFNEGIENANDDPFSLVLYLDNIIRFGLYNEIFNLYVVKSNTKIYFEKDHRFEFQEDTQNIIVYRGGDNIQKTLTRNLLAFLTKDISDIRDAQAKTDYIEILQFAIGPEILNIKNKKAASSREELLIKFRKANKFRDFICGIFNIKGHGYRELSKRPIVIGKSEEINKTNKLSDELPNKLSDELPNKLSDELPNMKILISPILKENMARLSVLYGQAKASGTNKDVIHEYTGILDYLKNNGRINKQLYKSMLYKLN